MIQLFLRRRLLKYFIEFTFQTFFNSFSVIKTPLDRVSAAWEKVSRKEYTENIVKTLKTNIFISISALGFESGRHRHNFVPG